MRWLAAAVLGVMLAGAVATVADARPGGGHSYSGGSRSSGGSYRSSSSSSGGGGSGDAGALGLIVLIGFGVVVAIALARNNEASSTSWTSTTTPPPATCNDFKPLLAQDPAFSQVVFEDFAFELYARAQRARGKAAQLETLTPYIAPDVLGELSRMPPVDAVVIGSLRTLTVQTGAESTLLTVRIEANLATATGTTNVIERWVFQRVAGAASRAPDRTKTFPCPQCNAPFAAGSSPRTCAHCGTEMNVGRLDWTLTSMSVGASSSVGQTLTGTVVEVGTNLTTIVEADAYVHAQALYHADPNVTWDVFAAHLTMTYARLNAAWNAQDLTLVRGLVTHSLLGYLQFWIDEYKRQRLANKLDDAKISRLALAKVQRDSFYDAFTVRVFADGCDYTVDANGKVVGGSKTSRRAYSEYWTFIRAASRRGPVTTEPKCPNCGAPLSISNAGACTHCDAMVETGSFDWVLSKIEQDEVYLG